jgi:hypothetical protein
MEMTGFTSVYSQVKKKTTHVEIDALNDDAYAIIEK